MINKKEFTEKDYTRISLIFAVLMANGIINYLVGQMFDMGGMVVSVAILGVVMVYCYKTMVKIKFPATALVFIIIVTVYYLFTREVAVTTLFGRHFMFYFLAAAALGMYKCDSEKFLRFLSYAIILIIPFYTEIFIEMTSSKYNTNISMGLSYSMFPILLASMVHFVFYRKKANVIMYVIYAVAAFLLISLALKGNRGIVLSLVVFVAMLFVTDMDFNKKKGINILKLVLVLIGTAVLIVYFYDILDFVDSFLKKWGIEANFIEKMIALENKGDITNGRSYIFQYTTKHIIDAPIMGHGLGTIFYNSGFRVNYPHNIFLQLLYDGGLILFIPVVYALIQALYYVFMGEDRDEAVFTLFIMAAFLPKAFVSGDIWENEAIWLLIMHSLKYYVVRRKKVKVKNQRDVIVKMGSIAEDKEDVADVDEEEVQVEVVYD